MSTKAEMEALIDLDLGSGSTITAVEHRNVAKDSEHSFVENIYPDVVDESTINGIFTRNTDFKYFLKVTKTGRKVNINGQVIPQLTLPQNQVVFDITDTEYQHSNTYYGSMINISDESIRMQLIGNQLITKSSVVLGEVFEIDFNYNVTN